QVPAMLINGAADFVAVHVPLNVVAHFTSLTATVPDPVPAAFSVPLIVSDPPEPDVDVVKVPFDTGNEVCRKTDEMNVVKVETQLPAVTLVEIMVSETFPLSTRKSIDLPCEVVPDHPPLTVPCVFPGET